MKIYVEKIKIRTEGRLDIIDITADVTKIVRASQIKSGFAIVFCVGSTCAVTTMEYEEGLKKDLREALERLFPKDIDYEHNSAWGDYNGHSHIRASFLKPDLTVPVLDGQLVVGRWQQIVFIELDIRKREREIVVEVIGE